MENFNDRFNRMMNAKIKTQRKLTGCAVPFRTALLVLNAVFILIAIGLIALSIAAFIEFHTYSAIIATQIPTGLLLVAILMLVVSAIGFWGTYWHNRCLLMVYFSILVLMLIGQSLVAYFSISSKHPDEVLSLLQKGWISEAKSNQANLQFFEATFCCCGFMNATDYPAMACTNASSINYQSSDGGKSISCQLSTVSAGYWPGCGEKLQEVFTKKMNLITGVSITVACLEALAVAFSSILFCCISCCYVEEEEEDPYLDEISRVPLTRDYYDRDRDRHHHHHDREDRKGLLN